MDEQNPDILIGADQIGKFLNSNPRRAYRLLETGQIPAFKLGGRWYARKSTLEKRFAEQEQRNIVSVE